MFDFHTVNGEYFLTKNDKSKGFYEGFTTMKRKVHNFEITF